jgi:hypothetical protein
VAVLTLYKDYPTVANRGFLLKNAYDLLNSNVKDSIKELTSQIRDDVKKEVEKSVKNNIEAMKDVQKATKVSINEFNENKDRFFDFSEGQTFFFWVSCLASVFNLIFYNFYR